MHPIIRDYLYHLNTIEKKQEESGIFYFNFPEYSVKSQNNELVFLNDFFLEKRDIFLNKHNRYADYPLHTHEFLEINFMLAGQCTQFINGEELQLQAGQLLLLDKGSSHEIKRMGHDDLLLNLLFKNKGMNLDWLTTLNQESNLVFDFLMQNIRKNTQHSYILFESSQNQHVQEIMERIIHEYFLGERLTDNLISMYIPILITELVANVPFQTDGKQQIAENNLVIQVLREIEINYATTSLENVAKRLGYNKNYLSNRIKVTTGLTFTELLNQERMRQAKFYLINTTHPVETIMQLIGLENKTYFYKIFKKQFGTTPFKFRKNEK